MPTITIADDVAAVRREIAARMGHPNHVTESDIAAVLERVGGDVDLTATAIVMEPRPSWLHEMIPHGAGMPIRPQR